MDLRHLRYFLAVAEELHFGRAAARLGIAQPPLSQAIRNLERELDVVLFERTSRRVALTPAGAALFVRAEALIAASQAAVEDVRRVGKGAAGTLSVGVMSAAMLDMLIAPLRRLRETAPGLEIDIRQMASEAQIVAIADGRLDVGLVDVTPRAEPFPRGRRRIATETAWREAWLVALPPEHPLASARSLKLEALTDEPMMSLPRAPATGFYDQVIALCQAAGFSPHILREVEQLPALLTLVAAGHGIALVPACVHTAWRGAVRCVPLGPAPSIGVTLAWDAEASSAGISAFRAAVRAVSPSLVRLPDAA